MKHGNYLEKLLNGAAVEWRALGEVANYVRGLVYNKSSESEDVNGYKVLRANNISLSGNTINFDEVKIVNLATKVKTSQKLYKDDILISAASGSREHVGKVAYINEDIDYYFGGFMGVVRCGKLVNSRYIFHILTSDHFKKYLDEMLNTSTINNLSSSVMDKFQIPIPPLPIQKEIVRILDKFTEITTEITTEIITRKQQYQYYRDKLLSFEEGEVEWRSLGELGEFIRGNGLQKKDFTAEGFPAIHYGQIYTKYGLFADKTFTFISQELGKKLRKAEKNDLLLATTSENDEDVVKPLAWLGEDAAISGDMMIFRHKQNAKYLAYIFQTEEFQSKKVKYITGAKVRRVSSSDLAKIPIPIPCPNNHKKSLAEQARIVAILDKFDALTTSLTEGLPRELALRQQQYAYYRDLLLNFPRSAGT